MSDEPSSVRNALLELQGKRAWGLIRTHGSMLFLEVGDVRVREEEKPCGQWHFLVEMCHWRFQTADVLSVGSDDDSKVIDQVFAGLELGTVGSCTVATPSYDLEILFSTGQRFNTFSALSKSGEEWNNWNLYTPDDHVWVSDSGRPIRRQSIFS